MTILLHKRNRGRPNKTWDSTVAEYLKKREVNPGIKNEAKIMVKNKKELQNNLHTITTFTPLGYFGLLIIKKYSNILVLMPTFLS